MRYLIDTQILIWLFGLSDNIPKNIHKLLKDTKNDIFVSSVSIWEIAIKKSVGKLTFPFELKNIINEIEKLSINILDISSDHLIKVAYLPFHHKDPFDRLIISQAIIESLPIISSDRNFNYYDIKNIW
jgi:PIN domain nuclease of toxin-antitoxin system